MSKVVVIKGQSVSEMTDEEYAELSHEVQKITSEGNMVALGEDKCFFCGQSYFSDEYQMFYSAKDVQIYVARCNVRIHRKCENRRRLMLWEMVKPFPIDAQNKINEKIATFFNVEKKNYCSSIDAIFSLEDKLREKHFFFNLQSVEIEHHAHRAPFLCKIESFSSTDFTFYPEVQVYGSSPSEAFCVALELMIDNNILSREKT